MSKKNRKYWILIIIILIIALILGIIIYAKDTNQTTENNISKYENINLNEDSLNILFFYVGQADSTLITMNGYNMLIDCGNKSDGQNIVGFLKAQNINKIDYLIGTHVDEDHIGGMVTVAEELEIGTIYMPYNKYEKECYDNVVKVANDKMATIEAEKGTTYSLR